jgi:hypothetical protein
VVLGKVGSSSGGLTSNYRERGSEASQEKV